MYLKLRGNNEFSNREDMVETVLHKMMNCQCVAAAWHAVIMLKTKHLLWWQCIWYWKTVKVVQALVFCFIKTDWLVNGIYRLGADPNNLGYKFILVCLILKFFVAFFIITLIIIYFFSLNKWNCPRLCLVLLQLFIGCSIFHFRISSFFSSNQIKEN